MRTQVISYDYACGNRRQSFCCCCVTLGDRKHVNKETETLFKY